MERALLFVSSSLSESHHFRSGLARGINVRKDIDDREKVLEDHTIDHRDYCDHQRLVLTPFVNP